MKEIIEYLKQKYKPLGVIVYGSFADGSNNEDSDFDVLVIVEDGETAHDSSAFLGVTLDAFIYPRREFDRDFECEKFVQLYGGLIALDTDCIAKKVIDAVTLHVESIVPKTDEENRTNVAWCEKMLLRAMRDDAEGLFRWHWLLTESLEIYCDIIGKRYLGPKKSIKRMQIDDATGFSIYEHALRNFDYISLSAWISYLNQILNKK